MHVCCLCTHINLLVRKVDRQLVALYRYMSFRLQQAASHFHYWSFLMWCSMCCSTSLLVLAAGRKSIRKKLKGIFFKILILLLAWEWTNMLVLCRCLFVIIAEIQNNEKCCDMFSLLWSGLDCSCLLHSCNGQQQQPLRPHLRILFSLLIVKFTLTLTALVKLTKTIM